MGNGRPSTITLDQHRTIAIKGGTEDRAQDLEPLSAIRGNKTWNMGNAHISPTLRRSHTRKHGNGQESLINKIPGGTFPPA